MRWMLFAVAMTMACGDDTPSPGEDAAGSDETGSTSGSAGSSDGSMSTSEPSPGSSETAMMMESSDSDGFDVDCYDDLDCPGTEVCTQWSPGESSCEPSGECSSKVECPPGFECISGTHHTTNGECVAEDASSSGDSGSSSTG